MPKYIKTDKYQDNIFTSLKLSRQIIEGSLEYTIMYIVDNKIDVSPFEIKIKNDTTGRPAWNPKILFKNNSICIFQRYHIVKSHTKSMQGKYHCYDSS